MSEPGPSPGRGPGPYGAGYDRPPGTGPVRSRRTADVVVTVVLLVLISLGAVVAAFFGLFVGMFSDGCFDSRACADRVGLGTLITAGAPVVCWLAAVVGCTVQLSRRRAAFWVPLVAVAAWMVLVAVGVAVAGSAMPA